MTVRSLLTALVLAVALLAAGCGRDAGETMPAETDEPLYVHAQQLKRQGRNAEALLGFLKVIEKRGEQFAEESHLEAGLIYLHHNKDFIEAIHHFQRYLALEPNSRQAPGVRELVNTAKREFARTLPARPADDLPLRAESAAEIEELRRENAELRAQIATLRGGGAVPVSRSRSGSVTFAPPLPPVSMDESPMTANPVRIGPPEREQPPAAQPRQSAPPQVRVGASGRVHTVRPGDTLFAIARQADPASPSRKVQEIVDANRQVLPQGMNTPLKAGMELRIP